MGLLGLNSIHIFQLKKIKKNNRVDIKEKNKKMIVMCW
jgi:hypothetical protein